jgi:hypothetical protein
MEPIKSAKAVTRTAGTLARETSVYRYGQHAKTVYATERVKIDGMTVAARERAAAEANASASAREARARKLRSA